LGALANNTAASGGNMRWMSGIGLFVAGTILGILIMQPSASPKNMTPGVRLNHVGLYVKNLDESVAFYKKMGFRQVFTFNDAQGHPVVYMQVDHDTFMEFTPATAEHPAGLSHMGIWSDDLKSTVAALRQNGIKVDDVSMGVTKAHITNLVDPDGLRTELLEFPPESLQRKAINAWK
jgi:lactoylglutathione lyase